MKDVFKIEYFDAVVKEAKTVVKHFKNKPMAHALLAKEIKDVQFKDDPKRRRTFVQLPGKTRPASQFWMLNKLVLLKPSLQKVVLSDEYCEKVRHEQWLVSIFMACLILGAQSNNPCPIKTLMTLTIWKGWTLLQRSKTLSQTETFGSNWSPSKST